MDLIGVIGLVAFGLAAIGVAIWHEFTWWRKWNWERSKGIIVGFKQEWSDCSISYYPEIEYLVDDRPNSFVSKYGSSKMPVIGNKVCLLVSPDGLDAEQFSVINRILFTLAPVTLGVVFIVVGATMEPIGDQPLDTRSAGEFWRKYDGDQIDKKNKPEAKPEASE